MLAESPAGDSAGTKVKLGKIKLVSFVPMRGDKNGASYFGSNTNQGLRVYSIKS